MCHLFSHFHFIVRHITYFVTPAAEAMSVTMPTPPLSAGVSFEDRVQAVKRLIEDGEIMLIIIIFVVL